MKEPAEKLHVDELRQRLRSMGYLDAGVNRFVLGPAIGRRRPAAIALLASLRVGALAAFLLGPAAAVGLNGRIPGLITGPRDAAVVAVYLAVFVGIAAAIATFVTSLSAAALARRRTIAGVRRVSRVAGVVVAVACLAYLTLWWRSANAGFGWTASASTALALVVAVGISLLLGQVVASAAFAVAIAGHEGAAALEGTASRKSWVLIGTAAGAAFVGDPQIVGKTIQLDGSAYTVVGVMPASFVKPESATLWVPLVWTAEEKAVRGEHSMAAVARLKPGVTVQQAQAQLDTIAARIAEQYPADSAGWGAAVVPLREETVGDVRKPLLMLFGAVMCVLLIACANVANLMLARTVDRRKEIAIRTAFGAKRIRIIQQVISESLLVSVVGGALGLIVAHFGTELVVNYFGSSLPRLADIKMDGAVLAFAFGTALVSGTVAGVAPAWRMSKSDPNDALKQGMGRLDSPSAGKRTRAVLVVTEVALSLVLLVGAALMIRTLWNLGSVHPGFVSDHVLTMRIGVAANEFPSEGQQVQFYDQVLQRVRALPGVQFAAVTDDLPLEGGSMQPVAVEGKPVVEMAHQPEVSVRLLSPQFMKAMGIPILRGREFTDADTAASAPVVLVSESMARQFWPDQDPIGKRLTLTFFPKVVREVVGVVGDVKDRGLDNQDAISTLYWPLSQFYAPPVWGHFRAMGLNLVVRSVSAPESMTAAVRNAIHEISPAMPLTDVRSMNDIVEESLSPQRFNMLLLAAFAGLALVLAAVGLYSVVAYATRQRVKEIGIRMALGANGFDVLRAVVLDGLRPTLVGIGIGIVTSILLSHVIATLIYGVKATDASTYAAVAGLLTCVGLFASILPAYRATQIDPLRTLRDE